MAIFDYCRGRVRVYCTASGCGRSLKGANKADARLALAHHNYQSHPGVFPRWNPNAEAVEERTVLRR